MKFKIVILLLFEVLEVCLAQEITLSVATSKLSKDFTSSLTTSDLSKEATSSLTTSDISKEATSPLTTLDISKEATSPLTTSDISKEATSPLTTLDISKEATSSLTTSDISKEATSPLTTSDISKEATSLLTTLDISKEASSSLTISDLSKEEKSSTTTSELTIASTSSSITSDLTVASTSFSTSQVLSKKAASSPTTLVRTVASTSSSTTSDLTVESTSTSTTSDFAEQTLPGGTISDKDKKYCKIKCETLSHTLCSVLAPPNGPPLECAGFLGGLSRDERTLLLDLHNELRRQVAVGEIANQPLASNMMKLVWDEELAHIAQRWADQCTNNEHDVCRVTIAGERSGQNLQLFTANSRKDGIKLAVTMWFGRNVNFNKGLVEKYERFSDAAGSYSQMVWAKTTRVGCGFVAQIKDLDSQFKLVCNYVPPGHVNDEKVYIEGLPCTKCPLGSFCSDSFPGLCTRNRSDHNANRAPKILNSYRIVLICLVLHLKLLFYHNYK